MAENSFDSQQTEQQIEKLQQDIQTDQTKLDSLQASLPQKAQDMGMVPQQDSVTIDLNGYQPSDGSK
jgi:Tfp pilus assembly protein PilN